MQPYASYTIILRGTNFEVNKAIDCIVDVIGDQKDAIPYLLDRYYSDDDDDEDILSATFEEIIEIWQTHDCVWIEDIEKLAIEIAMSAPDLQVTISGHIEDTSVNAGDEMDFEISYKDKKLFSQVSDWYQCVHMSDFPDYATFAAKVCDLYGNPRYSQEDYEGFRLCADEWYILDSGQGEFSTNAPLHDPVRIKLKKPKRDSI